MWVYLHGGILLSNTRINENNIALVTLLAETQQLKTQNSKLLNFIIYNYTWIYPMKR